MVIKYDTCSYSGYKIAPGHGLRFCEVNGKIHLFINKKNHRLYLNGKKPLKIRWNLKWRTANKKGKVEEAKKKVQKQKKERQVKAIVGLSVEEINKIQESFKDTKQADAMRYEYIQEIKEKRKKYLAKVKKNKGDKAQHKDKAIKNIKGQQAGKKY